jgi:hypothetical protein
MNKQKGAKEILMFDATINGIEERSSPYESSYESSWPLELTKKWPKYIDKETAFLHVLWFAANKFGAKEYADHLARQNAINYDAAEQYYQYAPDWIKRRCFSLILSNWKSYRDHPMRKETPSSNVWQKIPRLVKWLRRAMINDTKRINAGYLAPKPPNEQQSLITAARAGDSVANNTLKSKYNIHLDME